MDIYSFHLMPWPYLPSDYDGPAAVTLPNEMFDPEKGSKLINQYLEQLVSCERLGFDGVGVNEHHQMAWGLMGSPNVAAAMLVARTERLKVLVLGPALPLYGSPIRVAEELALLDLVSGGRIIAGPVVGGAVEYYAAGISPAEARGRFKEALELLRQAWTRPGPFEFRGEFYQLPYVNPWLLPLQKPHPPIWVPGAGSLETIDMCVAEEFTYSALPFFPKKFTDKSFALFRQKWLESHGVADPKKLSLLLPVYIAETDEQARKEFEPHFWYWSQKLTKGFNANAPGYMTEKSALRMMSVLGQLAWDAKSFDQIEKDGYVIVGSPSTVREKLSQRIEELGAGSFLGMLQLGSMPHGQAMSNLEAFSEEVIPALRSQFPDGPDWANARSSG